LFELGISEQLVALIQSGLDDQYIVTERPCAESQCLSIRSRSRR
jgi:hypothetical protein